MSYNRKRLEFYRECFSMWNYKGFRWPSIFVLLRFVLTAWLHIFVRVFCLSIPKTNSNTIENRDHSRHASSRAIYYKPKSIRYRPTSPRSSPILSFDRKPSIPS